MLRVGGCALRVTRCGLRVASYALRGTRCGLRVARCELRVTSYALLVSEFSRRRPQSVLKADLHQFVF